VYVQRLLEDSPAPLLEKLLTLDLSPDTLTLTTAVNTTSVSRELPESTAVPLEQFSRSEILMAQEVVRIPKKFLDGEYHFPMRLTFPRETTIV
jgi:hypothetical protein